MPIGWLSVSTPDFYRDRAKKRNKELKKLRSVSKAYRKSATRELNNVADRLQRDMDREQEALRMQIEQAQAMALAQASARQLARLNSFEETKKAKAGLFGSWWG